MKRKRGNGKKKAEKFTSAVQNETSVESQQGSANMNGLEIGLNGLLRNENIDQHLVNSLQSLQQKSGNTIQTNSSRSLGSSILNLIGRKDLRFNEQELDSALLIIKKIMKMSSAEPFNLPVNPAELGIPDYFDVIDTPMDFSTICENLEKGHKYMNSEDVYNDVQLIWNNCIKFNKKGDFILELMKRVKSSFNRQWNAAGLYRAQPDEINGSSVHVSTLQETTIRNSEFLHECHESPVTEKLSHQPLPVQPCLLNKNVQEFLESIVTDKLSQQQPPVHTGLNQFSLPSVQPQQPVEVTTPDDDGTHKKKRGPKVGNTQPSREKVLEPKKKIIIESDGTVVGENAGKWSSRTGDFIRAIVPIHYIDWRKVPQNCLDDVWKNLMDEFEFEGDISQETARPLVSKNWSQYFRSHKNALRLYMKSGGCEAPDGIDPIIWEQFVKNESDPKKMKQKRVNSEIRKQNPISNSIGRCSFGQKAYKMENIDSNKTVETETDIWLRGHKDKNGERASTSVKPNYSKIKEANKKQKMGDVCGTTLEFDAVAEVLESDKSGDVCGTTLEGDAVAEELESDKRGGVQGMGSHETQNHEKHIGAAEPKEASQKEESSLLSKDMKDHIQACVTEVFKEAMSSLGSLVIAELKNRFGGGIPHVESTPKKSDIASNDVHQSPNLRNNLNNTFNKDPQIDPPVNPLVAPPINTPVKRAGCGAAVVLVDENQKEVAKGFLVTDSRKGVCHGKKVGYGKKKVWVNEVVDPNAQLLFPKSGDKTFAAYSSSGGYAVWMAKWLVYI